MRLAPATKAVLGAVILALVLAGVARTLFVRALEHRVLQALGPRATVGAMSYRYPALVLEDVRITADGASYAWPAQDEAKAQSVILEATIGDLLAARHGGTLRVANIAVDGGTLSVLRTSGHLLLLPALREQARAKAAGEPGPPADVAPAGTASAPPEGPPGALAPDTRAASPARRGASFPKPGPPSGAPPPEERPVTLLLEHVHLEHVDVEVYDATLDRARPNRLVFSDGRADIDHIALPAVAEPMALDLQAALKGPEHDGTVSVKGSIAPGERNADLSVRLAGGDLAVLQPYLLRFGEGGVKSGRMDLQLDAHVAHGAVRAPGHLVISGLQFSDEGGTFAGVSRRAVLAALTKNGRLDVKFTLEGRLDDPKFALNEKLGGRIAVGLADAVGVSVKNAVESVGDAIKGLLGAGSPPPRKP